MNSSINNEMPTLLDLRPPWSENEDPESRWDDDTDVDGTVYTEACSPASESGPFSDS